MTSLQIGMVIFPGMTNLDFAGPFEVFARMPNTTVHVLAKDRAEVPTDLGSAVPSTLAMGDAPVLDVIFIGGGPGINRLLKDEATIGFLEASGARAKWVTSVCTGALALGAAGLLRGYRATTHWTAMEALAPFGAIPTPQRVVIDRNRATGGGVTAGIDFALTIARLLHGDEVAQGLQLGMEYNPEPPFAAGSPATAPSAIIDRVRAGAAMITRERIALAREISALRGWTS